MEALEQIRDLDHWRRAQSRAASRPPSSGEENVMGKYFIAWILGVPAGLLLLIYLFTHLF